MRPENEKEKIFLRPENEKDSIRPNVGRGQGGDSSKAHGEEHHLFSPISGDDHDDGWKSKQTESLHQRKKV